MVRKGLTRGMEKGLNVYFDFKSLYIYFKNSIGRHSIGLQQSIIE